ncbi:MAG: CRISPR-associated endonuclease Cas2 [Nocardioides sp.]|uniref:CRISPR-associated endonuclease Cas2 n=1 Tax=Nocardioides sp. TaxID=35761 RepID=UPI0039E5D2B7
MKLLVTYDVSTTTPEGRRRLRRVARICEGFGQRVQYSVFEVVCSRTDYARLLTTLSEVVVPSEDSLRVYPVDRDGFDDVIVIGAERALDPDSAWNL